MRNPTIKYDMVFRNMGRDGSGARNWGVQILFRPVSLAVQIKGVGLYTKIFHLMLIFFCYKISRPFGYELGYLNRAGHG